MTTVLRRIIGLLSTVLLVFTSLSVPAQESGNEFTASRSVKKNARRPSMIAPKGLYFLNQGTPTRADSRTMHNFFMTDTAGRAVLYQNIYGRPTSAYFIVVRGGFNERKKIPAVFDLPEGTLRKYLTSHRSQKLLDSLMTSQGKMERLESSDAVTRLIVLEESRQGKSDRFTKDNGNGDVQFEQIEDELYEIKINKNMLRGGPRFRR